MDEQEKREHMANSLREQGYLQREIGEIVGCTQATVSRILDGYPPKRRGKMERLRREHSQSVWSRWFA